MGAKTKVPHWYFVSVSASCVAVGGAHALSATKKNTIEEEKDEWGALSANMEAFWAASAFEFKE